MTTLFIDADACPVKEEAVRVATRHGLPVVMVSNQGMRPSRTGDVKNVLVGPEFDAADNWIAEHAAPGDIVITADIVLAGRCLAKGAGALNPNGKPFNAENIGSALAMRELNAYLREAGEIKGSNPGFTDKDRSRFLQALDGMIMMSKKQTV